MKKLRQLSIISIVAFVMLTLLVNLANERFTPRLLGTDLFPLQRQRSFCVDQKIRELSSDGNDAILVKTDNAISAYSVKSGTLIWSIPIKKQVLSFPPRIAGDKGYVSDDETIFAFNLITGSLLWEAPLDGKSSWIPDASNKFVLLNSVSDHIDIYDAESGAKLWSVLGGRGFTPAFIGNDAVYIVDRGLKAMDAASGKLLWQVSNNRPTGLATYNNGVLYFIEYQSDQTFDVVAYSVKISSELWRTNFVDDSPNGLYIYDQFLFMAENSGVREINAADGKTNWIIRSSDPTNLTFVDQNLYVLEQFHREIHAVNILNGEKLASLQASFPRVFGSRSQEMVSTGSSIVFSQGCKVHVYGKK
jgi:outer membrane protein assembly factor BamB